MKKYILLILLIALVANVTFWYLMPKFTDFKVIVSTVSIVLSCLFLWMTDTVFLKAGFKWSLLCLYFIFGIIKYVLILFIPNQVEDNWGLVVLVVLTAIEVVILLTSNVVSKKIA